MKFANDTFGEYQMPKGRTIRNHGRGGDNSPKKIPAKENCPKKIPTSSSPSQKNSCKQTELKYNIKTQRQVVLLHISRI